MQPNPATKHLPRNSGIYEIVNITNNKVYVGSSVNINIRVQGHIRGLNRGNHHGKYLQAAWNKHGINSFMFRVIELCPVGRLIERENFWILERGVLDERKGYNTYTTTATGRGYKQTKEHVEKRKRLGRPTSEATREAVATANKNRVLTDEQREAAKLRLKAGKDAIPKEEFTKRLSESVMGRKLTEEQKLHLSEVKKEEWRKRLAKVDGV